MLSRAIINKTLLILMILGYIWFANNFRYGHCSCIGFNTVHFLYGVILNKFILWYSLTLSKTMVCEGYLSYSVGITLFILSLPPYIEISYIHLWCHCNLSQFVLIILLSDITRFFMCVIWYILFYIAVVYYYFEWLFLFKFIFHKV